MTDNTATNWLDHSFRHASPEQLANCLQDARNYTLALFECFLAAGLDAPDKVPVLEIINPPLWELGHIAWFAEWFVLREAQSSHPAAAQRPSLLTKGDDWFDSNTVPHDARWTLDLPRAGALKTYCHEVLDRVLDKLSREAIDDQSLYPYRLVLAHEDMHGEAFAYTLQTLNLAAPEPLANHRTPSWAQGEIRFPGGTLQLGSPPGDGVVFDNEKWAHATYVPTFTIDSTLVSNAQFAEFVADGGYQRAQFWSVAGRTWLMQQERSAPRYWQRDGQRWNVARFGRLAVLPQHEPVRHISLFEAQAYCMWAGRRLPTEAEWDWAATSGHAAFRWGDLWEWTASPFEPYPGFSADAYREYSAPWFGSHQVLRGASFATQSRMRASHYRNFYLPRRDDMFVGFRTCTL